MTRMTHAPCCTAHGVDMTCERYRRTHLVEVRPCCSVDAVALREEAPAQFEAEMNSGAVIVDNASERLYAIGELEPDDQDERPDGECGFCGGVGSVDDGDRLCPIGCWRVTA